MPSPFGAGSAGLVSRFERDFVFGNAAGETCAALAFIPASGTVYWTASTGDSVALTWLQATAQAPGSSFLAANARQFRCLAACAQVMWPGSELNRQGIISLAQGPAEEVASTVSTVGNMRSAAQHVERMPEDIVEIKWRPNDSELQWNNAAGVLSAPASVDLEKYGALFATSAGAPAATGIRVRLVAIYEWLPRPDVAPGMSTSYSKPPNTDTLTKVLTALDAAGHWTVSRAGLAARAASSLYSGLSAAYTVGAGLSRLGRLALPAA